MYANPDDRTFPQPHPRLLRLDTPGPSDAGSLYPPPPLMPRALSLKILILNLDLETFSPEE